MKATLSILLAAGVLISGCAHRGGPPGGMMPGGFSFPVSAAPIARGEISQTFSVTGTVNPLQQASLSSVVSGAILSVGPQIGERVTRGELLVQIDDSTLRAQLQQSVGALEAARARLAQTKANDNGTQTSMNADLQSAQVADATARANLQRTSTLFKQGFVSQTALDQARQQAATADAALRSAEVAAQNAQMRPSSASAAMADMHNAQAAVDQASANVSFIQAQLAQTSVRAPFDGVVVSRNVDPGTLSSPGATLMEVAQLDPVFVDMFVAGDNIHYVHVGTPVTITVTGETGRAWHGKVAYVDLAAVPGTLTYKARIPIANSDLALRGGMVASIAVEQAHKSGALLAPRAAVFQTDTGFGMYIIDSGKAKSIPVEIGLQNDQEMEVSGSGLAPGVQAILNHAATLQPGMPVQILPPQNKQQHA